LYTFLISPIHITVPTQITISYSYSYYIWTGIELKIKSLEKKLESKIC
jgi:hypothetical protein